MGKAHLGDVLPGVLGRARHEDVHRPLPQRVPAGAPVLTGFETIGEATPGENLAFSAQGLAFSVNLQRELKRPVGFLFGAVQGSPSGRWLERNMFWRTRTASRPIRNYSNWTPETIQKVYEPLLKKWEEQVAAAKAAGKPEPGKPQPPVQPNLRNRASVT